MLTESAITLTVRRDIDIEHPSDYEKQPFSENEKLQITNGQPYLLRIGFRIYNMPVLYVYDKDKRKIGIVSYVVNEAVEESLLAALFDVFDFEFLEIERGDGFIHPKRCEFERFNGDIEFTIKFSSQPYPRG